MTTSDEDERAIEQAEALLLERYQESLADYLEGGADMYLRDVLKNIVAGILQRHVAAATDEIANAMADEIEALARDRLADLRAQLESGDEPWIQTAARCLNTSATSSTSSCTTSTRCVCKAARGYTQC